MISNVVVKRLPLRKPGEIYSLVEVDGVGCNEKLKGGYLEAAFSYNDNYILLFVSYGDGWEEVLYIYLLDLKGNKIVDRARIGGSAYAWLSACCLRDIKILSDNSISFEFMSFKDSDGWLLELFNKPIKTFPFALRYLPYIFRPISSKRYFLIKKNKISLN
ncbi:hypothetical protein [Gilliamella sp. Imp1-1]|uniref:hypothetical protein n=1 Tax=Gilliamella sp. Imp1-1 TaxID=3120248 RepID=UPI000460EB6D|nr:hypothetical protein [Gilliamella apicola]KDN09940.1 hypothetical protein GAPWKB30_1465 [Gilliamella apicola]OCG57250.1 hypothetical protein A9G38_08430 [Gilliamella apicola]